MSFTLNTMTKIDVANFIIGEIDKELQRRQERKWELRKEEERLSLDPLFYCPLNRITGLPPVRPTIAEILE